MHGAPARVLAQHLGRNLRFKGSPLCDRPGSWRHQCRSRQAPSEHMRVRFSDSEQWSAAVKPPRSQNYVKPHDARTRVHVANSMSPGPIRDESLTPDRVTTPEDMAEFRSAAD